jgi:hypothetical protein
MSHDAVGARLVPRALIPSVNAYRSRDQSIGLRVRAIVDELIVVWVDVRPLTFSPSSVE